MSTNFSLSFISEEGMTVSPYYFKISWSILIFQCWEINITLGLYFFLPYSFSIFSISFLPFSKHFKNICNSNLQSTHACELSMCPQFFKSAICRLVGGCKGNITCFKDLQINPLFNAFAYSKAPYWN